MAACRETGNTPAGMIVSSSDPAMTEIIAVAGYEFVVIDGEHAPLGPREWLSHIRAAQAGGITAMYECPRTGPSSFSKLWKSGLREWWCPTSTL